MTSLELEVIRTRIGAASPAPWPVRRLENKHPSSVGDGRTYPCVRGFRVPKTLYQLAWQKVEADAAFMAHAREDMPAMLQDIIRLRALLADAYRALSDDPAQAGLRSQIEGEVRSWEDREHGRVLADRAQTA